MTDSNDPLALDYFSGGVPTGVAFGFTLSDLRNLIARGATTSNRGYELGFIGLVSYFEAFCKDHLAALINIEPDLLQRLRAANHDIQIDPLKLLGSATSWRAQLGFLVTEKFDFGSSQKINSYYKTTLQVTPFGKDDSNYFDEMLRDRNLLVHHGGVLTSAYAQQVARRLAPTSPRPFYDSLAVTEDFLEARISFISGIAQKLLKATETSMSEYIAGKEDAYSIEQGKAIAFAFAWELA